MGSEKEQINTTPKSDKYFPSLSQQPNLLEVPGMSASSGRKGQPNGGDDEQGNLRERGEGGEKPGMSAWFFFFPSAGNLWRWNNGGGGDRVRET